MKITKKTRVIDAFMMSKDIADVFRTYKLECPGCKGCNEDTIAIVVENHGLDSDTFIDELNNALKN